MIADSALQGLVGRTTDDPLDELGLGGHIRFADVPPIWLTGGAVRPHSAINWHAFEGALLGILVKDRDGEAVVGSAAMIAPGLAVTAAHNLREGLPAMVAGEAVPYCVGFRSSGLELWAIRHISVADGNDLALLSLVGASALPSTSTYWKFRMTTRTPKEGEELVVLGFVENRSRKRRIGEFVGAVHGVIGKVVHVYHRRDSVLMPYPTIEIACGSLGGMSGGPVLDLQGHLVGVISRGLDTEDGAGPTFASWIIDCLRREVTIEWPKGLVHSPATLVEMDDRIVTIVGRHALDEIAGDCQEFCA